MGGGEGMAWASVRRVICDGIEGNRRWRENFSVSALTEERGRRVYWLASRWAQAVRAAEWGKGGVRVAVDLVLWVGL